MIERDWFDWSNAAVGVTGLVLSGLAIVQATGAKQAATLAARSVRRHVAEVDFGSLLRMAKELHGYVQDQRMTEARLRTTDLRSELAVAIHNHRPFLDQKQYSILLERQVDLKLVTDGLNRNKALSRQEQARLVKITGAILDVLAAQTGGFRSSVEKEVPNE
jgi:hypothetical protein